MSVTLTKTKVAIATLAVVILVPATSWATHTFTDVEHDRFYSDAVQWAFDNGITTGTSPTTFSPDAPVTRGQNVTFAKRYDDNIVQPALADIEAEIADLQEQVDPLVNSVAAFAGGDAEIPLSFPQSAVVQSVSLMPPADGTVIVNSFVEVVMGAPVLTSSVARCSITTDEDLDFGHLQLASVDLLETAFQAMSGTRGYQVTEGVLFTVNLFCDAGVDAASTVFLLDPSLTAIFAPT